MQVISIFIAVLAVTRLAVAQSQTGYNYPSPFNPLTPGSSSNDLGGSPGSSAQQPQQSTPYAGSQSGYNNQQFSPSGPQGPSSFSPAPTLTPGFNQQPFGQPTASSLPPTGSHSNVPGHSSGGFGPSPSGGFPSTATPSKGFDGSFPHSGGHSGSVGHSGGAGHSGFAGTPSTFPSSPGFQGAPGDVGSSGFGGPSSFGGQNAPGQSSFGAQGNNFGQTGGGGSGSGGSSGGSGQFDDGSYSGGDYSAIPGTAGVDYPIYTEIPKTSFDCKQQQFPGYYADVEAQCQVFHICALNTTFNFLCPNGTIFSQEHLVCVWWNQFDCNSAPNLYGNNAYIYDYSKTGQQQQPQDGSNAGFGGGQANAFDGGFGPSQPGSQGFGGSQSGAPGFGPSQSSAPGFGASGSSAGYPSGGPAAAGGAPSTGFGSSGASGYPSSSGVAPSGGFGTSGAGGYPSGGPTATGVVPATGFGSPGVAGYPASPPSGAPTTGFGQPSSHSTGFDQSHLPAGGSSHTSSHQSGHSFPSQTGGEPYPAAPPSQTDYQPSVIPPTIPSSPAPFGITGAGVAGGPVTGYPAAGTPSPSLTGEQPSREYLPSRRT